jgi:O-antigen/teichoic acid export membrane protein
MLFRRITTYPVSGFHKRQAVAVCRRKIVPSPVSNTQRIAKNTLMLYFRQILIMLVSLYTVRVVLETLGAEDYGIYNVVAGVVTMFGFLSSSMATSSQRFFAFELGRGDHDQLKRVFSLSLMIYVLIALIVLLLAETIGLWFVANKLIIPVERKSAALWVYQFSVVSFLFTIMAAPYMAVIIAREDMNIYARVSIAEAVLKLGVVFLLRMILFDKLQLYGILLCGVAFINTGIYRTICRRKYRECTFLFYWDKDLFKEITGFTGWNLFGAVAGIFKIQTVNILLNQFFNPAIVATRSIAININNALTILFNNFSIAINPQIIKNYASDKKEEVKRIMFLSSKFMYFMMYVLTLPTVLEMSKVLSLWLKVLPEDIIIFTRLAILDTLICSIGIPLGIVTSATGRIKIYQSVLGTIHFLNFPLSLVVLMIGFPAYSTMIIAIFLSLIAFVVRLFIVRKVFFYPIKKYFFEVLLPVFTASIVSAFPPVLLYNIIMPGFLRLLIVYISSFISISFCVYFIGIKHYERKIINNKLSVFFDGIKRSKCYGCR